MMDIVPDAAGGLILLVAVYYLSNKLYEKIIGAFLSVGYIISSVVNIFKNYSFHENYLIGEVFYTEEKQIWSNRLLSTAYIEFSQNNFHLAEILFNLYFNNDLKQEFFKNILRKSIYEYFVMLKFNTELNNGKYTLNKLDEIISQIEELWVCTK